MISLHDLPSPVSPSLSPPIAFERIHYDVDDLNVIYPGWRGRFQQVSAGHFRSKIQVVQGQFIRVFRGTTNRVLLTRGASQPGWIDFAPVTRRNQGNRWQGLQLDPNRVVVRGAHVGVDNLAARDVEVVTLSISIDLIRRAASRAVPTDRDPADIDWMCPLVAPEVLASLDQLTKRIVESSLSNPACLAFAEGSILEQESVLASLGVIASGVESVAAKPRGNRAEVVRRGEEYLREHLTKPLGLIDLCEEIGVSARTAQYAFRECFGIGPIEYLRMLRLNSARADLKRAHEAGLGVRDIAFRWGYHHLGNFAAEYQRHFGELPSQTVKAFLKWSCNMRQPASPA